MLVLVVNDGLSAQVVFAGDSRRVVVVAHAAGTTEGSHQRHQLRHGALGGHGLDVPVEEILQSGLRATEKPTKI